MVLKHADWIQHIATERCRTCKHLCPLKKFSFEEVRRCCNIFLARTPHRSSTVRVNFWDIIIFFVLAACIRCDIVLVVGRIFTMWDIERSIPSTLRELVAFINQRHRAMPAPCFALDELLDLLQISEGPERSDEYLSHI